MSAVCDHTSVGVVVLQGSDILLIRRKNFPVSIACVAGHCDGDEPEVAARRELREEAGIEAVEMRLMHTAPQMPNPCKREDGTHHDWHVFEAVKWRGDLCAGSDALEARFVSHPEFNFCLARTVHVIRSLNVKPTDIILRTQDIVMSPQWQENPGLEPVWFLFFLHMANMRIEDIIT